MITIPNIDNAGTGYLGNKMFMIAAALALADRNNDEVVLVPWLYENVFKKKIKTSSDIKIQLTWRDPAFHYTQIPYLSNLALVGYFQSEKYFLDKKDLIKEYYTPLDDTKQKIFEKYPDIQTYISLHVRRTDYFNFPSHHPICGMDYYINAINFFDEKQKIIIVSDDKEWAKQNFVGDRFIFSDEDGAKNSMGAVTDLFIQSYCQHNIICNSSFSWWGAWLNENPNKKIIAPKTWFGPAYAGWNTKDLLPESWIKC
jgi:hypothetical protein